MIKSLVYSPHLADLYNPGGILCDLDVFYQILSPSYALFGGGGVTTYRGEKN